MCCDVGKETERLENELCFTYVTVRSPTLLSHLLRHMLFTYVTLRAAHGSTYTQPRHNSFSNPSFASSTSQALHLIYLALLILQPFRHFTFVTTHSPTLPSLNLVTAHSPTLPLLHLRHSSFSNPSFASPTSQALHFEE